MSLSFEIAHPSSTPALSNGQASPRGVSVVEPKRVRRDVDLPTIEQAVRKILEAVGENPERDGLVDTPRRVARMYAEMFSGLQVDPGRHLKVTFPEEYDEVVLVRDIDFTSMCEHHLLPFRGVAHVAYIPNGRVTGLSKLARVVEEVARRPQV
jgi:GTP cyclohydrolase I